MTQQTVDLRLTPRDPIVARDGRPFGNGQNFRMRSLEWLYPSVVAGSLRTLLGKHLGGRFDEPVVRELKEVGVAGPLPIVGQKLFFPAPRDAVVRRDPRSLFAARPQQIDAVNEGCDLPDAGLQPVMLLDEVTEDFKPARVPAFWSIDVMRQWLLSRDGKSVKVPPDYASPDYFLEIEIDERKHVSIDPDRYVAKEHLFYSTAALAFPEDMQIALRVVSENQFSSKLKTLTELHPLGGERRLVHWSSLDVGTAWDCPTDLAGELRQTLRLRMVLSTPAIFRKGWCPGWIGENLQGNIPGTTCSVRLLGVCGERWRPVSGWSLERGRRGEKPVRRLVPSGSVYFFERVHVAEQLPVEKVWLQPVSDEVQDRRDGFGLAVWGVW